MQKAPVPGPRFARERLLDLGLVHASVAWPEVLRIVRRGGEDASLAPGCFDSCLFVRAHVLVLDGGYASRDGERWGGGEQQMHGVFFLVRCETWVIYLCIMT